MAIKQILKSPLVQVLLISTFVFILFFPKFYTSTDEKEYIENAYLITRGEFVKTDAVCYFDNVYCGYFNGQGYISKYNLGLSFIFIPFVLIDWQLAFVATFAAYLIGVLFFSKLLNHYKLSQKFLYLYAFFPLLIYYSKKPLGEIFSNTIVLAIFYLLFVKISPAKPKSASGWKNLTLALSGALAGILVLIRYTNAIVIIIFGAYYLYLHYKNRINIKAVLSRLGLIFLGALPFLIAFLLINKSLYGGYFTSGYSLSREEFLILPDLIPKQLLIYTVFLNILYPGMLVLSFLSRIKHRWMVLTLVLAYLVFYMGFPGYSFSSGILDLIFGLRFFMPIIGLILLLYFDGLTQLVQTSRTLRSYFVKFKNLGMIIAAIIMITSTIAISYVYNNRVSELRSESDQIYTGVGEIIEGGIEKRILLNEAFKHGKKWVRITNN